MVKKSDMAKVEKTILHKEYHARLLQDIEQVAAVARVMVPMIHRPLATYCPEEIVDWVKSFPEHMEAGSGGLCITGKVKEVDTQMQAMACAFLRNYMDARVLDITSLLKTEEDPENPTVLLVPDFYVRSVTGQLPFTNWQLREMYSLLLERHVQRRATVLYVQEFNGLRKEYGDAVHDFIESHYTIV
jgi:hypothetical protein